eukprot:TRINITY_DN111_c0_g1_i3.p1 TRINITY_DN111_c0_g1~~TRINITY_DN111_c0_g1_i3.p1  ORF type:complete len:159 (+),score=2.90 TRINITY_DN111_c0_g1_i3:35-478(+)
MATRATASAIFPLPVETVWKSIRDFTFPAKLIGTISSCEMEEKKAPTEVGAIRKVTWKTGEWRRQRLIEFSDQFHKLTWELIESSPPSETEAVISTVRLFRITETNQTLVEWSSDFSADAPGKMISFEQKAYAENLNEMRKTLTGTK